MATSYSHIDILPPSEAPPPPVDTADEPGKLKKPNNHHKHREHSSHHLTKKHSHHSSSSSSSQSHDSNYIPPPPMAPPPPSPSVKAELLSVLDDLEQEFSGFEPAPKERASPVPTATVTYDSEPDSGSEDPSPRLPASISMDNISNVSPSRSPEVSPRPIAPQRSDTSPHSTPHLASNLLKLAPLVTHSSSADQVLNHKPANATTETPPHLLATSPRGSVNSNPQLAIDTHLSPMLPPKVAESSTNLKVPSPRSTISAVPNVPRTVSPTSEQALKAPSPQITTGTLNLNSSSDNGRSPRIRSASTPLNSPLEPPRTVQPSLESAHRLSSPPLVTNGSTVVSKPAQQSVPLLKFPTDTQHLSVTSSNNISPRAKSPRVVTDDAATSVPQADIDKKFNLVYNMLAFGDTLKKSAVLLKL